MGLIYKTSYDERTKMLQRNQTYEKFAKERDLKKIIRKTYEQVTKKCTTSY